jgi:hypothetical protein
MILSPICEAITTRLKADTGAGGLYYGGAWNGITGAWPIWGTPGPSAFPRIVFGFDMQSAHSTTADEFEVTLRMTVMDDITLLVDSNTFEGRISQIIDRIHGDSVLQNGRTPTYGFNRHRMVLPTNGYSAKASWCLVTGVECGMVDEKIVQATTSFKFRVTAIASNP